MTNREKILIAIKADPDQQGLTDCPVCEGVARYTKSPIKAKCDSCRFEVLAVPSDYEPGGILYEQSAGHFGPGDQES